MCGGLTLILAKVQNLKCGKMAVNYKFECDPIKARENRDKHGVDFE